MLGTCALAGRYYVPTDNGTLIADFSKGNPELWLENQWATFRLLPAESTDEKQLSLPLGLKTNFVVLEEVYGRIFNRTVKAIHPFHEGQRELFDFCLYFGIPAIELAENTPALAFVAANEHYFKNRLKSSQPAVETLNQKRLQILQEHGFPPLNWVIKLFQKIPAAECRGALFHDLKCILDSTNQQRLKKLRHLKTINHLAIKILSDEKFSTFFHSSFLAKISVLKRNDPQVSVLWQLYALKDEFISAIQDGFHMRLIQSFPPCQDRCRLSLRDFVLGSGAKESDGNYEHQVFERVQTKHYRQNVAAGKRQCP